jgi:hypothetical protein
MLSFRLWQRAPRVGIRACCLLCFYAQSQEACIPNLDIAVVMCYCV